MTFGRILPLLILLLLVGGCVHPSKVTTSPVSSPLPFSEPAPTEMWTPEPLLKCYGGNMVNERGVYTNDSWPFSSMACVMEV